jgi:hypothetical protein
MELSYFHLLMPLYQISIFVIRLFYISFQVLLWDSGNLTSLEFCCFSFFIYISFGIICFHFLEMNCVLTVYINCCKFLSCFRFIRNYILLISVTFYFISIIIFLNFYSFNLYLYFPFKSLLANFYFYYLNSLH